jgi:hypothetical protein
LHNEEDNPGREDRRVKIEDYRSWGWWMNKAGLDRAAEAIQHNNGDQQGHEEIEGLLENAGTFCPELPTIG